MKYPVFAVLCAAMFLPGCSFLNSIGAPDPAPAPARASAAPAPAIPAAPQLASNARDPWCDRIANQDRERIAANGGDQQTQTNIYNSSYFTCVGPGAAPPR